MWTLLLNPYAWLVTLALLTSSYAGGRWHQYRHDLKAQAEAKFTESENARLRERSLQASHQRIADEKEAANRKRVARLTFELERLRNRPDRLPEASRPACSGATGAELSGRDAAFLVRLASRADELREALDACQKREAVNGHQEKAP